MGTGTGKLSLGAIFDHVWGISAAVFFSAALCAVQTLFSIELADSV